MHDIARNPGCRDSSCNQGRHSDYTEQDYWQLTSLWTMSLLYMHISEPRKLGNSTKCCKLLIKLCQTLI